MASKMLLDPGMNPLFGWLSRHGGRPAWLALSATTAVAILAASSGLLDPLAFLITVGGALGVTRVTFSGDVIRAAWERLDAALGRRDDGEEALERLISSFKRLARIHRVEGARALDRASRGEPDEFLRCAVQRALECSEAHEVRESLYGEARVRASEGERARSVLLTLGRLFPAFGLIGTLIGLVMVLRGLGGEQALENVAPALGVTVLTTLYGAILANVVVLPLATKLQDDLAREALSMQVVIHGAEMLFDREYPTRIERALRTHAGLPAVEESLGVTVLHEQAA